MGTLVRRRNRREGGSRADARTILSFVSPPPPDRPGIRISDADREQAAARLHQALSEGRITVVELEERVAAVYAAIYASDLRQPLADLPGEDLVVPSAIGLGTTPLELRAGATGIRRAGDWGVPARLRVASALGPVVLDFCKASIEHPVVEVELVLGAASARLILPDKATANVDALVATMGSIRSTVPSQPQTGCPHFVVRGHTRLGSVTVRRRHGLGRLRF